MAKSWDLLVSNKQDIPYKTKSIYVENIMIQLINFQYGKFHRKSSFWGASQLYFRSIDDTYHTIMTIDSCMLLLSYLLENIIIIFCLTLMLVVWSCIVLICYLYKYWCSSFESFLLFLFFFVDNDWVCMIISDVINLKTKEV